jgi:hypothetical protein
MIKLRVLKSIVHWLLLVVAVLYFLSGYGITQFRVVSAITFGVINKAVAFKIHDYLWIPFVVLLIAHILFAVWRPDTRNKTR